MASQFSERLAEAMRPMSAAEFSRKAGVTEGMISKYLAGKSVPRGETMVSLARALQVSVEWLASGQGPMRVQLPRRDGVVEEMLRDQDLAPFGGVPAGYALLTDARDEGMEPQIRNGAQVVFDTRVKDFDRDGVYVLQQPDGSTVIRRLSRQPDGRVVVICDNKAFDSRVLDLREARLRITGRAIAVTPL